MRGRGLSVTQIASDPRRQGMPVSAQTVWKVLRGRGLPRLPRRRYSARGPAGQVAPVKAAAISGWPAAPAQPALRPRRAAASRPRHSRAGVARADHRRRLPRHRASCRPGTPPAPCCWLPPHGSARAHHIDRITDDAGLAFFLGLTALPKATHLGTYSYRARRDSSQKLLTGLIQRLRALGLATGDEGFNCDFHAIRHHGDDPVLDEHYVPAAPSGPARS